MDAIAAGDFTTKLAPISLGEFGQLGSSFNHMVQQLNQLFEERDRQLRESFSGAHILLDTTGLVLQADHAARRIIGEDATDMVGLNILDATLTVALFRANPRLRDALQELVAEALSGHPAARSVLVRHPEGGASRYLVTTLKLEGRSPQEDQVLLEVRDITGMAGFYEQIQRADRLAAVGTLATGIAHEIRNPLASIRGMVQLLAEAGPEGVGSSTEYTTRILREVDRLEKLISGIMDFANKEGSPPEEVDINALLTEVVESARLHVGGPAMEVALIWELDSSLPKAILQAERIRQALLNLMVNAFQHCVSKVPKGPIRIQTIHLAVNQQRPIIICLSNPAEALDEIARERIFEPFYTTKPEGTGLGLPIAYQTVASNGGILEVECEGGEIQFWVRLPTESPRSKTASRILPRIRRDPVRTPEE
jgi:nitrogen-specific signal transduction histidine kinase